MKFIKTKVNQCLIIDETAVTSEYEIKQINGYLAGNKGLNIVGGYRFKHWVVSHQRSGIKVFDLSLPFEQVKEVVKILSDIIDWTIHEDEVLKKAGTGTNEALLINKIRFIKPETYVPILTEVKEELEAKKPKK